MAGRTPDYVAEPGGSSGEDHLTQTEVRRKYAEFHRRLGEMMLELLQDARVYWVGDLLREAFGEEDMRFANAATGHELHLHKDDDAAKNVYRKAVYVINDAKPYQNTLERLVDVQREVMALTGNAKPYDGILEPLLIEEVALVRLRSHPFYLQRKVLRETLLDELGKRLEGVKKNARAFEAVNLEDEATRRLHGEIEHLKRVMQVLESVEEPLLLRTKMLRVLPSVNVRGQGARQVYVRDVGLIVCGPHVRVQIPPPSYKVRSDKVTSNIITPLASYDNVTVYRQREWQERIEEEKSKRRMERER